MCTTKMDECNLAKCCGNFKMLELANKHCAQCFPDLLLSVKALCRCLKEKTNPKTL